MTLILEKISLKKYYFYSVLIQIITAIIIGFTFISLNINFAHSNITNILLSSLASVVGVLYIFATNHTRAPSRNEYLKISFISSFFYPTLTFLIAKVTLTLFSYYLPLFGAPFPHSLLFALLNFCIFSLFYKWFGDFFVKKEYKINDELSKSRSGLIGWLFATPSITCFSVAVIISILQLVPYTGLILLTFSAPLLIGYLVSFGFILVAIESVLKKIPVWMIIFPILYFGGYWLYIFPSYQELSKLQSEVNKDLNIPFNAKDNALVFLEKKGLTPDGRPNIRAI